MKLLEMKKGINGTFTNAEGKEFCLALYSVITNLYAVYGNIKNVEVLSEEEEEDLLELLEEKIESIDMKNDTQLRRYVKSIKVAPGIIQKYLLEGYYATIDATTITDTILAVYTVTPEDLKKLKNSLRKAISCLAYGFNRQFDSFKSKEFYYTAVKDAELQIGCKIIDTLLNIEMSVPPVLGLLEQFPDLVEKLESIVDIYIYSSLVEDIEEERINIKDLTAILTGKVRYEDWKEK